MVTVKQIKVVNSFFWLYTQKTHSCIPKDSTYLIKNSFLLKNRSAESPEIKFKTKIKLIVGIPMQNDLGVSHRSS